MNARTELPPLPRKPVYGPAAREEALRLMSEAKREKINFGWSTKTNLCRMANGERPLSYSVWEGGAKVREAGRRERKHEQDVQERPLQVRVVAGKGSSSGGGEAHRREPEAPASREDNRHQRHPATVA